MTEISAVDEIVSDIMSAIRPALTTAVRHALERGREEAHASFASAVKEATRLLSGIREDSKTDTQISAPRQPSAERAALGTVKPRILELVSRESGTSISELEQIGLKPNSIRGTLYALQKEGVIQRRGLRWYAAAHESSEAPEAEAREAS